VTALALFSLSACQTPKIDVEATPINKPDLVIPQPDYVSMRDIKWYIVTEQNFVEVIEKLKAANVNPVLFALTDDGYEALSLNFAEIKKYIDDKNSVVLGYKEYYEGGEDGKRE
jgi:hypothetical protein